MYSDIRSNLTDVTLKMVKQTDVSIFLGKKHNYKNIIPLHKHVQIAKLGASVGTCLCKMLQKKGSYPVQKWLW